MFQIYSNIQCQLVLTKHKQFFFIVLDCFSISDGLGLPKELNMCQHPLAKFKLSRISTFGNHIPRDMAAHISRDMTFQCLVVQKPQLTILSASRVLVPLSSLISTKLWICRSDPFHIRQWIPQLFGYAYPQRCGIYDVPKLALQVFPFLLMM